MKSKIVLILLLVLVLDALNVHAQTPFAYYGRNGNGTINSNLVTMQAWPPQNGVTVYGTNIVFTATIYTNIPDATGFFSNALYPNTYVVSVPSAGLYFFAKILDTTNYLPLAYYATNVAVVNNPLGMYALVTNWLGYAPLQPTTASIITALGYTPLTNTFAAITNAMHYTPATNSFAGIVAAACYTALTNSFAALTNAIGYVPATNSFAGSVAALGYQPATNTWASITNLLVNNGGVPAVLGYQPATNNSPGIFSALGYIPANITNTPGLFAAGPGLTIITNGVPGLNTPLLITTNLATGVLPTLAAPNGSILVSTNGSLYVRTNSGWVLK